jgi:hypothetical protein
MSIPAYTVYGNHPRVLFRDTDKTALTARTNDSAGWQNFWDNTAIPRANTFKAQTDAQLVTSKPDLKLMVLAFVGYIEETGRPANGYKDVAIRAALYLAGLSDGVDPINARERIFALTLIFDILYDDMTSGEKNTLAAEIRQQGGRMTRRTDEEIDGHSGTDQALKAGAMLAIHGWGNSAFQADTVLDLESALGFWYGDGTLSGRIDFLRWQYTDGGSAKGSWYTPQAFWGELLLMQFMAKGTTHNAWSNEQAHLEKVWEYLIWSHYRGGVDDDFEAFQDTSKPSAPRMHHLQRWMLGLLATNYPTPNSTEGGRHLRWLFDRWDELESAVAENRIFDVIFLDRAAVAAVHPKDGSPVPETTRLMSPPGLLYYRQAASPNVHWDYDNSMVIRINGTKYYRLGHPHLDCGSCQIRYKDDVLLLSPAGLYDDYSTEHHTQAYQRSWLQSLVPLIHDPAQTFQRFGTVVDNDGGQHFKKVLRGGSTFSDPWNLSNMLNEGGGEAWLLCRRMEVSETNDYVFCVLDIEPAYRKFHTDSPRCAVLELKYLIIKPNASNGLTHAAVLYYARVVKTDSAWKVQIPFHTVGAITTTATGFHATGYRTVAGNGSPGKLWVELRSFADYTLTNNTPGTPLDANGYGPNQFKVAGTGTNRPPNKAAGARHLTDLKKHSIYWERTSKIQEEHYVGCLYVTAAAASDPASGHSWVSDGSQPHYYGRTMGTKTYLVHRTEDLVAVDAPDTTAPANVTGQTLGVRDKALLYTYTDPADSDFIEAEVFYRTSAT